jgi:putative DNA primase/helicase
MATEPRLFLQALFAGKPDDLHILLWTLPEKESRWFQSVEDAIRYAESMADRNLYVGVGLSTQDYGATKRCLSNDVAGIVGVWADFDLKSDAHPQAALPATIADALKILPERLPPTFLIETGNGIHGWWLFREPWIFESEEDRKNAVRLVSDWQTLLRLNAAGNGWAFDRLSDLARVLRVPGTRNCKNPESPKPVKIHSYENITDADGC